MILSNNNICSTHCAIITCESGLLGISVHLSWLMRVSRNRCANGSATQIQNMHYDYFQDTFICSV